MQIEGRATVLADEAGLIDKLVAAHAGDHADASDAGNYLGDPAVTTAAVRVLFSGMLEDRAAQLAGTMTEAQSLASLHRRMLELTRVADGTAPGYVSMPEWNPDGLASLLRQIMNIGESDPVMVIRTAIARYADYGLRRAAEFEADELSLDDYQTAIEALVEELGNLMAGIPPDVEGED